MSSIDGIVPQSDSANQLPEEWRDIPGFEGRYQVSNQGRVLSTPRERTKGGLLKLIVWTNKRVSRAGCLLVTLHDGRGTFKKYRVHRLVALAFLNLQSDEQHVDHVNRDTFDNRASNLRLCTPAQNHYNAIKNSSGNAPYKGVCFRKRSGKWTATIGVNGKPVHLGTFDTPEEARDAYREAARKYAGEFARCE